MDRSKNLLFVDDELDILEILVDLFTEEGYGLHVATCASDALQIVEENPIDFVLTDLKLPDGSGKEFLKKVHEINPDTVRVLTSGYFDMKFGQIREDQQDGTIYLSKPWDLSTLKRLVEQKLG